jgi:type IV secretion system protein VirB9
MRAAILTAICVGLSLCCVDVAEAEMSPRAGKADERVRTVHYRRDDVVKVTASYGTSTMIIFGQDEKFETIALGDTEAWQAIPTKAGNILFVKPIEKNPGTNMNVVTNKRIYFFSLDSMPLGKDAKTYGVRLLYPEEQTDAQLLNEAQQRAAFPNIKNIDKEKVNLNYSYKGGETLKPGLVFDDGTKTFFKFNGDVPAIFMVADIAGNETLVNGRREGEYIVVDRTAAQWTLRQGNDWTCVFNLRTPDPGAPPRDPMAPKKAGGGLLQRTGG